MLKYFRGDCVDIQILVVEDDIYISDMIAKFLMKEGYCVDICLDGDTALEQIYNKNYHLIILDILLPGIDGQKLLKELREIHDTPVLMITALSDDTNQLRAFSNGADDYVVKPFSMQILIKRSEALLRRSGDLKEEIRVGELLLYPETYHAIFHNQNINLTPKEFEILMLFVKNKGKIIPHKTMLTKLWGYNFEGNDGIVHASVKKLRDKLPKNIIKTVKGIGYFLEDTGNER